MTDQQWSLLQLIGAAIVVGAIRVTLPAAEDTESSTKLPTLGFRQEPHLTHGSLTYVWADFPETVPLETRRLSMSDSAA